MKHKINLQFLVVTFASVLLTMLLSTVVFYESFKNEILDDMKTYTHVLKSAGVFNTFEYDKLKLKNDQVRITIISSDGTVDYDNEADVVDMDNHGYRPEVEQAFKIGEGTDIRMSAIVNKTTFYYAVVLDNGYVLRVAKESSSIYSIFISAIPVMLVLTILLLIMGSILAYLLTKSIIKPIEKMAENVEHMELIETYSELQPFIDTIHEQHEDILKSAKIRQEFTANVSHELKTPLTSISGYSELIENGMAVNDDVVRFAAEIHRNSNRLLTLINDIIRLSELDVSENVLTTEEVDIYAVAQVAVDMMQINAQKHNVDISIKGNKTMINADKSMMEEMIYNLTDNAIRYNKNNGSVMVSITTQDNKVILSVKDTGIGIPEKYQERIFERFYRVDKSRSKSTGGTGLGLAIVKHIVAQNGAEMQLTSEPGVGTEIKILFDTI